jgi:chromosome segregation ATPase
LEGVSDESEKLKAEHEGLKGEHGVLRREQEKLKGDHDELQGDLEKLKGEHLDLQRRLEEAQSSSATHEATITSLRSELDSRPAESVPSPKPNGVESSSPSHIDESAAQLELSASVERIRALEARMEPAPSLRVSSGRMAAVGEEAEGDGGVEGSTSSAHAYQHAHAHVPKQFGDEIVFCCPACEGDLITL